MHDIININIADSSREPTRFASQLVGWPLVGSRPQSRISSARGSEKIIESCVRISFEALESGADHGDTTVRHSAVPQILEDVSFRFCVRLGSP